MLGKDFLFSHTEFSLFKIQALVLRQSRLTFIL